MDHPQVKYDIGKYLKTNPEPSIKKQLILNPWKPAKNYQFPFSEHQKNRKTVRRYASQHHLDKFECLVLSDVQKVYFCKYCVLFVNFKQQGVCANKVLDSLVNDPVTKFAKLFGKYGVLDNHCKKRYRIEAAATAKDFLMVQDQPEKSIDNQLDTFRLQQIRENRVRLLPIVKTVNLLGRQNIPFRGHRDDGYFDFASTDNKGNFRAILEYRAETDDVLMEHLLTAPHNATHISKTTQNDLIECFKDEILHQIVSNVLSSIFFCIMFDETNDMTNKAQLTLVIRFVEGSTIHEEFLGFVDVRNEMKIDDDPEIDLADLEIDEDLVKLTGVKIGEVVLKKVKELHLPLENCIGISSDGCATMTSEVRGAVSTIWKEAVNAVFCPCQNHALNLSISQSSKVLAIKNAVATMQETILFLKKKS